MANTLTPEQRSNAEAMYAQMRAAQDTLWEVSNDLEKLIGCAVDTTEDLQGYDLQDFIDKDEPV